MANHIVEVCGKCMQPIAESEAGVRHFGLYRAHSEQRCLDLLTSALAAAEAERDRLRSGSRHAGRGPCARSRMRAGPFDGAFADCLAARGGGLIPDIARNERIGLSDRPLKNYEARGEVSNVGSKPHQGAKLAQSNTFVDLIDRRQ